MAHSVIDQAPPLHILSLYPSYKWQTDSGSGDIAAASVCLSEHPRCGRAPLSSVCDSNFTQPGSSVPEVTRQSDSELRGGVWSNGRGSRTFLPGFLHSLENPPHITTIVRATLLPQSKDQNSIHVFSEQMSSQLGWCEHRYNADRKPRQSLVEPIMGRAVGEGLQTPLFLCRVTLRYMINFLTKSTQAARSLPSL
ncbi:Nuclear pore complex protein 15 [Dissostichus eleginoides]|uniref:Nuclear pore complex protein 15 n=1 Tax=Dissostichus eleginoides TaxID=100907 RepID=A0AAD9C010_DISEL|nr:Nuclear pore complex protein 15 [Dissostichus eleginoides]